MRIAVLLRAVMVAGLLAVAVTGSAAGAQRIGPDLGPLAPAASCGAAACNLAQLGGAAVAASPADGTIVRYRVKHGRASSAFDQVRLLILERRGDQLVLVRESSPSYIGIAPATETFEVRLPIAAGQLIGVRVDGMYAPGAAVLAAGGPEDVAGRHVGAQPVGGAVGYAGAAGLTLLVNADLEPKGGSGSAGKGGKRKSGGKGGKRKTPARRPSGGSGVQIPAASCSPTALARTATMSASPARVARGTLRITPGASASAGWQTTIVDSSDNYNEVDAAFDRNGRLHVAGRGVFRKAVVYRGPSGRRVIENTNDDGSVAVATPRTGPLVGYGMDQASDVNGRLVYCDAFKLAAGPSFTPQVFLAQPENESGFFFADVAADPDGTSIHTVYELGRSNPRLFHQVVGGERQELPLPDGILRQARIAAEGDTVAIGARTDEALAVYVRRGNGPFEGTIIARDATVFDLAVGRDGRPRVAFKDSSGRLSLYTGRKVVRTGAPVAALGLAVGPGGRMEVALAPTAQACHTTDIWECRRGGLYLLSVNPNGTGARASTVQSTTGYSPGRIAVATHGGKVAVAYGDPAHSRRLTVRTRG